MNAKRSRGSLNSPAPNAGAIAQQQPEAARYLRSTFERRWANVLAIAADNGYRIVLLGAWGCGAFRNDPILAAETARDAAFSPQFSGAFDRVVFAIPNAGKRGKANLAAFRIVFDSASDTNLRKEC